MMKCKNKEAGLIFPPVALVWFSVNGLNTELLRVQSKCILQLWREKLLNTTQFNVDVSVEILEIFPLHCRQFLPNICYLKTTQNRNIFHQWKIFHTSNRRTVMTQTHSPGTRAHSVVKMAQACSCTRWEQKHKHTCTYSLCIYMVR